MEHFVAYHSVELMGEDYEPGKRFSFYSRKGKKLLDAAIGQTAWVIVGERTGGRTKYMLDGRYTPSELKREDDSWRIEGWGTPLKPRREITDAPWFLEMKREQNNFSLGFNRIRNATVIEALESILPASAAEASDAVATAQRQTAGRSPRVTIPEELADDDLYFDGAATKVTVNKYERDSRARAACLAAHGHSCAACGLDFGRMYGAGFTGLITVHHLTPLAQVKAQHRIDPINELCPLCPNCHFIAHQRTPPYTLAEIRGMLGDAY